MGKTNCVVPSCRYRKTKYGPDQRSMFKVPKDKLKAQRWAYLIPGIDVLLPNQHLCERHFEDKYVKHYHEKSTLGSLQRTRLSFSALPTIFDVENQDVSNFSQPYASPRYSEVYLNQPFMSPGPSEMQVNHPYISSRFSEAQLNHQYLSSIPSETQLNHLLSSRPSEIQLNHPYINSSSSESQLNHSYINSRPHEVQLNRSRAEVLENAPSNQSKSVETTLNDVVKDLSASEKILMQIKQEEFPPCEIKTERTEDVKMDAEEQTSELSPFEQLQNNFFHYTEKLPESWNATQLPVGNNVIFAFSKECPVNDGLALVVMNEKNIVLNRKGCMHYSIHGKTLVINTPDIPNVLRDVECLTDIVTKFNELKVCQGITSSEFEVDKDCTSYKDDLGFYRHVNCTLASDMLQCDSCYSYSQYLLNYTVNNTVNNSVLRNDSAYYHSPIY